MQYFTFMRKADEGSGSEEREGKKKGGMRGAWENYWAALLLPLQEN